VDLHLHSTLYLHVVVLNQSINGITLPFTKYYKDGRNKGGEKGRVYGTQSRNEKWVH
jgi:hypothetical protein